MYRGKATPMDFERTNLFAGTEGSPWLRAVSSAAEKASSEETSVTREQESCANAGSLFAFDPSPLQSTSVVSRSSPKEQRRVLHPRRRANTGSPKYRYGSDGFSGSDSGGDEDVPVKGNAKKRKKKEEASAFTGYSSTSKPSEGFSHHALLLPYMISGYIQMFFSMFIIAIMLYMIVQFILTVRHDLEMKAEEYSVEIIHQVAECSKNYIENKCDPKTRVQYMQKACQEWEICMQRDPKEVGRLKVGAETLAEILNKLVEPLSYKTMVFGTVLLFGTLFLTSTAFNLVKARASSPPNPVPIHMHAPPGPAYQYQFMPSPSPTQSYWDQSSRPAIMGVPSSPSSTGRLDSNSIIRRQRRVQGFMEDESD
ncbi:uncharacterized protein SPPG_06875 [Spizellomyces punctatus DAOM BR117]|uniref:Brl1/Brr6 domain-containing protein n=1 Tax=Spizellomyces punctatus (strain DAOM BR117) TaxID=645134 RepID=A0A0L0HAF5_SPIPD|nr:uncharacterized protein SPPG_06875 [Spizellomyces punctatus DAOM BR117]KNC97884.1 hypothetical protein SPPG_06875 [Spizellomyces punctatus DAOM BR117]|eukprot:XP_016605924.1 hypothetical protein SPPG_06875 [Spizellomyces punctatus DAOM BR117]